MVVVVVCQSKIYINLQSAASLLLCFSVIFFLPYLFAWVHFSLRLKAEREREKNNESSSSYDLIYFNLNYKLVYSLFYCT